MAVTISSTATKGAIQRKAAIKALLVNCGNPAVLPQMVSGLTLTQMVTWLAGVIGTGQDVYLNQVLNYLQATLTARQTTAQAAVAAITTTLTAVATG